jgi:uncharacterized protein YoxC
MDLLDLWKKAEDWAGVFDHLLLVIGAVGVAAIPSYFAHRNHKGIKAVQDQVQNAHTTNLRDDIDRSIAAVASLSQELRGLRQDVNVEQVHRRDQISDLRDYQRQLREDIDRKFDELNTTVLEMKRKK